MTIDKLADITIRISGTRIEKEYDLSASQEIRGRSADLTLIKKVLKWEPTISLEEGVEKTYKWIGKMVEKG